MTVWGYIWRVGGALLLLVVALILGLLFYAPPPTFPTRCGRRLFRSSGNCRWGQGEDQVDGLEFAGDFWVEVHDLTIHGLERRGELPYAHLDRL